MVRAGRKGLIVGFFILVMMGAAGAHPQTVLDADDTSGPLDIVAARAKHRVLEQTVTHGGGARTTTTLYFRLVTYETWSNDAISGAKRFISFEFDRDGDDDAERCVVITDDDEPELIGRVYRGCDYEQDELIGAVSASRRDAHSVRFSIEKRDLGRRLTSVRWRALTSFEEPGNEDCPHQGPPGDGGYGSCVDRTSWKRHRLEGSGGPGG